MKYLFFLFVVAAIGFGMWKLSRMEIHMRFKNVEFRNGNLSYEVDDIDNDNQIPSQTEKGKDK